jgi:hypothetical protein
MGNSSCAAVRRIEPFRQLLDRTRRISVRLLKQVVREFAVREHRRKIACFIGQVLQEQDECFCVALQSSRAIGRAPDALLIGKDGDVRRFAAVFRQFLLCFTTHGSIPYVAIASLWDALCPRTTFGHRAKKLGKGLSDGTAKSGYRLPK